MAQEPSSPGGSLGVKSVDEVQAMIQKSLELPKVKFLRQRMAEAGCAVKDNFFRAVVCQGRKGVAYFAPAHGIFVCSNHVTFQDEVNQLIIHELIHAYDDCRAVNLHWNNCAHQACSEIRAGHLSGDCHFMRELLRGHFKLRGHEPECIRRRVLLSLFSNPNCVGSAAKDSMEDVWDICYNDTQPFDKAP
ncbi:mitochondrial inner membrane protease ATP23-like isoform X1 [Arachis stenosperma]|uniref:mitochondrial inner membrane protease ATP23-like isoform X1 n=1 Tax=Arachis stenosperma TaxID=217475 RepID=UPI0025AC7F20|nr:mitochondrial inner membrane protease ATP23-like isoform X1 [Arachis stenosperma]